MDHVIEEPVAEIPLTEDPTVETPAAKGPSLTELKQQLIARGASTTDLKHMTYEQIKKQAGY